MVGDLGESFGHKMGTGGIYFFMLSAIICRIIA
jgi:hypothetical protein